MAAPKKIFAFVLVAVIVGVGVFFGYISLAFPTVRCEAVKHLEAPEKYADCVACHTKSTPKEAQDWKDSKHGVMLVKCSTCHGQPDGKGSIPFAAKPDPMLICARCHDPAIKRMVEKYGERPDCNTCHPNHQNPMHGGAYENKIPSGITTF